MSDLLGTRAPLNSDLNLLLQIIILVILLVGFRFGRRKTDKSLKTHGRIMELAVILNAAAILLVMGPVFVTAFEAVLSEISTRGFPLTIVHHSLGLIAEILGIVFVFRKPSNVRLWMRVTLVVWLIALAFGFAFYSVYYVI